MSSQGSGSGSGSLTPALSALLGGGEAAGSLAQGGIFLQLLTRIVTALEASSGGAFGLYTVYEWSGSSLNIASSFPGVTTGTFILKPSPAAAISVTIPASGGPWIVADGNGFCNPSDQITVTASGGITIQGSTYFYMAQAWDVRTFISDATGGNYIVSGS